MTEETAINFIDATYSMYIGSNSRNSAYVDDVIDILNKVTNSTYVRCNNSGFVTILKNNITVWKWAPDYIVNGLNVVSLYELLNKEILLHKLNVLEKGELK